MHCKWRINYSKQCASNFMTGSQPQCAHCLLVCTVRWAMPMLMLHHTVDDCNAPTTTGHKIDLMLDCKS